MPLPARVAALFVETPLQNLKNLAGALPPARMAEVDQALKLALNLS
jgi:hypothetical protein